MSYPGTQGASRTLLKTLASECAYEGAENFEAYKGPAVLSATRPQGGHFADEIRQAKEQNDQVQDMQCKQWASFETGPGQVVVFSHQTGVSAPQC